MSAISPAARLRNKNKKKQTSHRTSAVVERHHPVYRRPADGALLRLRQDVEALDARAHVTALQEHAGPLPAQAHGAAGGRHAALLHVELAHAPLLLLLELLQQAPLLPARPVAVVLLPQDVQEGGTGSGAEHDGQNPPQPHAVPLLPEEGVVIQPREEVAEALLGRLQLDQVVVEDQLADARDGLPQPQHLLGFVDALGPFPADEVADDVGQRLEGGVEVLVRGLQVQLRSVQRADDPDRGSDPVVGRPERERNRVGALVDDFLCVVPVHRYHS